MPISINDLQTLGVQVSDALLRGYMREGPLVKNEIATDFPMNTETVEAPILHQLPSMRVWEGSRIAHAVSHDAHKITAKEFEVTAYVPRKAVEDDNVGIWLPAFETLGDAARIWPDEQLAQKLELGESQNGFDKVPFFGTTHPVDPGDVSKGTFGNLTGSGNPAWYLFDSRFPVRPMIWGIRIQPRVTHLWSPDSPNVFNEAKYYSGYDARGVADFGMPHLIHKCKNALDDTNLETVETAMMGLKSPNGRSMRINPDTLLIPTSLVAKAREVIGQERLASGASNPYFNRFKIVVWHELSNS